MESSQGKSTRKSSGERNVSEALSIRTANINEAIADALRPLSAKEIARRIRSSTRTVEGWLQGRTGPQVKHVVAMLQDDELCRRFLAAADRGDLARSAETIAALRRAVALSGDGS